LRLALVFGRIGRRAPQAAPPQALRVGRGACGVGEKPVYVQPMILPSCNGWRPCGRCGEAVA
jgi:hypothetical protein